MKVLVFGAPGGTGRLVVSRCLTEGHQTSIFVHRSAAPSVKSAAVEVHRGDVLDPVAVDAAVEGVDGVVICLGTGPGRNRHVLTDGTTNVIEAMKRSGARRLVVETGAGLAGDRVQLPRLWRIPQKLPPMRGMFADKRGQERVVMASGLAWVIVRPANLTDGPATGTCETGEELELSASSKVSRADVAVFMVVCLEDDRLLQRAMLIAQPG